MGGGSSNSEKIGPKKDLVINRESDLLNYLENFIQKKLKQGKTVENLFTECQSFDLNGARYCLTNPFFDLSPDEKNELYDSLRKFKMDRYIIRNMYILKQDGTFFVKKGFDYVEKPWRMPYIRVKLNDKWNAIDSNGNYFSKFWFDGLDLSGKIKIGYLNGKEYLLDGKGQFLIKVGFDRAASTFSTDGYLRVELNNKVNLLDKNIQLVSKQWFDEIEYVSETYYSEPLEYEDGYYDPKEIGGRLEYFINGFAIVHKDKLVNYMDKAGNILSKKWFSSGQDFTKDGIAYVRLPGKNYKYKDRFFLGDILHTDGTIEDFRTFEEKYENNH